MQDSLDMMAHEVIPVMNQIDSESSSYSEEYVSEDDISEKKDKDGSDPEDDEEDSGAGLGGAGAGAGAVSSTAIAA